MKMTVYLMVSLLAFSGMAMADKADVLAVKAKYTGRDTFFFSVTVQHDDTGWQHYADKWEVVTPDGEVLGTRVLLHPHEEEQPFTRSLSGITIPPGIQSVTVRAHDLKHGWGGKTVVVELPGREMD